jgi:hypothetical protein
MAGELPETSPNGNLTEEFKCAQFLHGLPCPIVPASAQE